MQLRKQLQRVGRDLLESRQRSCHVVGLIGIDFRAEHQLALVRLIHIHVQRGRNDYLIEKRLERLGDTRLQRVADNLQRNSRHLADHRRPAGGGIYYCARSDLSAIGDHALHMVPRHPHAGDLSIGMDFYVHPIACTRVAPHNRIVPDDSPWRVIESRQDGKTRAIADVHGRNQLANLFRIDQLAVDAQYLVVLSSHAQADHSGIVMRHRQMTALAEQKIPAKLFGKRTHRRTGCLRQCGSSSG